MDLIAMRFEARHLELEGKFGEALAICRDILGHHAQQAPTEQLLPVVIQAGDLSVKLGDREGAASLLLGAAERYADAGMARPVIELYRRLRRLGAGRQGLDLRFARRMLERRHPTAAREFLTDLARRHKKEKLLATLERMEAWSDDKVQEILLDFLDKAQGLRVSAAEAGPAPEGLEPADEVAEAPPAPDVPAPEPAHTPAVAVAPHEPTARIEPEPEPEPEPVPVGIPPAARAADRGPRRPAAPAPSGAHVRGDDDVVFVTLDQPVREPEPPPRPRAASGPARSPVIRRPRRQGRSGAARGIMGAAAIVVIAVGVVMLVPRLRQGVVGAIVRQAPDTSVVATAAPAPDSLVTPAAADSPATPAAEDTATTAPAPVEVAAVVPPPVRPDSPSTARTARPTPPAAPPPAPARTAAPPPARQAGDTARPAAPPPPAAAPPVSAPAPATPGVDFPVVIVEGLAVLAVTREGEGAAQRVVVKQLLESGDTLDLRASDLGAASVGIGAGRVLVRPHPAGGAMGTVRVGRFLVNARAPVAPEVLEAVLARLVEKVPE
jgi:hypothetical protein